MGSPNLDAMFVGAEGDDAAGRRADRNGRPEATPRSEDHDLRRIGPQIDDPRNACCDVEEPLKTDPEHKVGRGQVERQGNDRFEVRQDTFEGGDRGTDCVPSASDEERAVRKRNQRGRRPRRAQRGAGMGPTAGEIDDVNALDERIVRPTGPAADKNETRADERGSMVATRHREASSWRSRDGRLVRAEPLVSVERAVALTSSTPRDHDFVARGGRAGADARVVKRVGHHARERRARIDAHHTATDAHAADDPGRPIGVRDNRGARRRERVGVEERARPERGKNRERTRPTQCLERTPAERSVVPIAVDLRHEVENVPAQSREVANSGSREELKRIRRRGTKVSFQRQPNGAHCARTTHGVGRADPHLDAYEVGARRRATLSSEPRRERERRPSAPTTMTRRAPHSSQPPRPTDCETSRASQRNRGEPHGTPRAQQGTSVSIFRRSVGIVQTSRAKRKLGRERPETDTTRPRPMGPRPFGKYLLDREIARGGMARVHLARLRGVGGVEKRLVVKEIDPRLARDPRFVSLFVEEARTLVEMSHPNIVPVYELGVVDGVYFLAMEHVDGATLDALCVDAPLEAEEVAHVGAQVADALAYAHERFDLVHRDVTPRNIMVDVHGHARLLDFGIATHLDVDQAAEPVVGTPGYLSPEQARGERLSPQSDIFSFGAVLYRAATGSHALEPTVEAARGLVEPLALPELAKLPDALAATIRAALQPKPDRRPSSARVLAAQLRAFLAARRPEGVAGSLGARAARQAALSASRDEETATSDRAETFPSGRTASLATSPMLERMLRGSLASEHGSNTSPRNQHPTDGVKGPGQDSNESAETPTTEPLARRAANGAPGGEFTTPTNLAPTRGEIADVLPRADGIVDTRPGSEFPERPMRMRARARATLVGVVVTGLAVWSLSMARFEPRTTEIRPRPLDPTPLELEPPDAGALEAAARSFEPRDASSSTSEESAPARASASRHEAASVESGPEARSGSRPARHARSTAESAQSPGFLTVQALPWAEVHVDATLVGRTPLRDYPLVPGRHEVVLRCPPLGRELRENIDVRAERTVRLGADLQASPPTVRVLD